VGAFDQGAVESLLIPADFIGMLQGYLGLGS
jgi:hypothetical protein